jgi:hypothetical protein
MAFGDEISPTPVSFGGARISYREASQVLTPASGFMSSYDYTLNPYSGCSFGCSYCYAAFFVRDVELQRSWGDWVAVKENALALLRSRRKSLAGLSIYMSSVTDPYQPVERKLRLTRSVLGELVEHQPKLVIQTRSGLVKRDLDLLQKFKDVRVNMTVTTDDEEVRRAFEPKCPTLKVRLEAAKALIEAGVATNITMTPLLPVRCPERFAEDLLATGVTDYVVQPFHVERGRFVAGTGARAVELTTRLGWGESEYQATVSVLRSHLPNLIEGREGFAP